MSPAVKAQKPKKMASKIAKQIFQDFGTKLDPNSGKNHIIKSTNNDKNGGGERSSPLSRGIEIQGGKTWAGEARTVIGLTSTPIPVESDCEAILAS
jgi:hypothetical protein